MTKTLEVCNYIHHPSGPGILSRGTIYAITYVPFWVTLWLGDKH